MIALITFFTCSWGCGEGTRKLGTDGMFDVDDDDEEADSNGSKIVILLAALTGEQGVKSGGNDRREDWEKVWKRLDWQLYARWRSSSCGTVNALQPHHFISRLCVIQAEYKDVYSYYGRSFRLSMSLQLVPTASSLFP